MRPLFILLVQWSRSEETHCGVLSAVSFDCGRHRSGHFWCGHFWQVTCAHFLGTIRLRHNQKEFRHHTARWQFLFDCAWNRGGSCPFRGSFPSTLWSHMMSSIVASHRTSRNPCATHYRQSRSSCIHICCISFLPFLKWPLQSLFWRSISSPTTCHPSRLDMKLQKNTWWKDIRDTCAKTKWSTASKVGPGHGHHCNFLCYFPCSTILVSLFFYGTIQFISGCFSYIVVMAENGFWPRKLLFSRKLWYSMSINDFEDSYGQEWVTVMLVSIGLNEFDFPFVLSRPSNVWNWSFCATPRILSRWWYLGPLSF